MTNGGRNRKREYRKPSSLRPPVPSFGSRHSFGFRHSSFGFARRGAWRAPSALRPCIGTMNWYVGRHLFGVPDSAGPSRSSRLRAGLQTNLGSWRAAGLMPDPLPSGQFAIRAECKSEVFARRRSSNGLADSDAAATAVKSGTHSERDAGIVLDEPFGNGRSVRQLGGFIWWPHLSDRLIVRIAADAAVPIHLRGRSATSQEERQQTPEMRHEANRVFHG